MLLELEGPIGMENHGVKMGRHIVKLGNRYFIQTLIGDSFNV